MASVKVRNYLKVKNGQNLTIQDLHDQLREVQVKMEAAKPKTIRHDNLFAEMIVIRASLALKAGLLYKSQTIGRFAGAAQSILESLN
jgi:hypothetical protein